MTYAAHAVETAEFLRRDAPTSEWFVRNPDNTGDFYMWDERYGPQPTPQECDDAAADLTVVQGQTFSEYIAENGGDEDLTNRKRAKEGGLDGDEAWSVHTRAEIGERNKRDNYLVNRIIELQDALTAIKNSTGPADSIRNAIPNGWLPTAERPRQQAYEDMRTEIDSGDADHSDVITVDGGGRPRRRRQG